MTAAKLATIGERLFNQLTQRMRETDRFLSPTDFSVLRWHEEIGQLAKADPPHASILRSMLAHMMGDVENFERNLDRAGVIGATNMQVAMSKLTGYSNLGFATKALDIYRNFVDIRYQNLDDNLCYAGICGGFQKASTLMKQARLANLELQERGLLTKLSEAAETLSHWPVSDDQCAQVIDAAGEVLREHELFWQETYPRFSVNPKSGTVSMKLRVNATPEFAAEMTMSTADKLIDRDLASLPFYVSFVGTAN